MTDKKIWEKGNNVIYYSSKSFEILKAFNNIIHGLYHIGDEEEYISHTLNNTTYVDAEYKRILESIGMDLTDIANKLELARSVLFGDCFNWDYICENLEKIAEEKSMEVVNE